MEQTLTGAITLVIAVVVAFIIEGLKHTKLKTTEEMAHLLSLILGLIGGMIAMYMTQGDFATYVFVGLGGAVASPGVYDMLINRMSFAKGVDK